MAALDIEDEYQEILQTTNDENQRVELGPTASQQIGKWTVMGLILNRYVRSVRR